MLEFSSEPELIINIDDLAGDNRRERVNRIATDILLARLFCNHKDHAMAALKGIQPSVMNLIEPEGVETIPIVEPEAKVVPIPVTFTRSPNGQPTIALIIRETAAYFEYTVIELLAKRRNAPVVRARHVAIYLAKKMTTKSLPEIGRGFRGMDHTSILYASRKAEKRIAAEDRFKDDVEVVRLRVIEAMLND